jgi:phosphomannomutase
MANKFIFDVDGTLTPSRQTMDPDFQRWFLEFVYDNDVYLVTGSDYSKTLEQVGSSICENVNRVYNCSGNDVWANGINIRTLSWTIPEDAHEWLSEQLTASNYNIRTGLHFEHRPGMVNFSVVGRNATSEQRKDYVAYDEYTDERVYIAHNFNLLFPELQATVGGETGIDVAPKGLNKSQIIKDFDENDILYFIGDRMDKNGNDYPLAQVVDHYREVKSWKNTWEYLQWFQEQGIAN